MALPTLEAMVLVRLERPLVRSRQVLVGMVAQGLVVKVVSRLQHVRTALVVVEVSLVAVAAVQRTAPTVAVAVAVAVVT
jgi:hypothetical protein